MSPLTFFATSGAITWLYLSWRFIRFVGNVPTHARNLRRKAFGAVLGNFQT